MIRFSICLLKLLSTMASPSCVEDGVVAFAAPWWWRERLRSCVVLCSQRADLFYSGYLMLKSVTDCANSWPARSHRFSAFLKARGFSLALSASTLSLSPCHALHPALWSSAGDQPMLQSHFSRQGKPQGINTEHQDSPWGPIKIFRHQGHPLPGHIAPPSL